MNATASNLQTSPALPSRSTRRGARRCLLLVMLLVALAGCGVREQPPPYPAVGQLSRYDNSFESVIAPDARIERVAEGFTWSEGPAWVAAGQYLLFTDVPENTLYQWSEGAGLRVFLRPSGYSGPPLEGLREPGANGLFVDSASTLLLADSGNREIARLVLEDHSRVALARTFEGKRFNSPNDLVQDRDGRIYFTDPPYGLTGIEQSPLRELGFSGVFRIDPDGSVHLLDDSLSFPNGIALSPDQRTLYVSNSDPKHPLWTAYALDAGGAVIGRRVFADASDLVLDGKPGLPDGMAVASDGTLFASGPGGVIVFAADGTRLGRIETGSAISNCTFGDDGQTLYMTSHDFITRVRVRSRGLGY